MSSQATPSGSVEIPFIPVKKRMKQVIKRIRTDGYIITQQDLEFIDREQDEWLQQWTQDPTFDKKVKDAREAYEGLRPRGTNGSVGDDDVNDNGCFDQFRRLNPQEYIAAEEASQFHSGPVGSQRPPTDLGPFTHDPIAGTELNVGPDNDSQDVRDQLLPPEPSWLPRSQEDDRLIAASYESGLIEDQDGNVINVLTEGEYYLQVWGRKELTQSDGTIVRVRKPLVPMRCVKVLARCTQPDLQETTDEDEAVEEDEEVEWRTCLSIGPNRIADNTAPEAVIAGYSGITGCPVFATPPSMGTIRSTIDMSDNSQGISFRTEHMNHLADGNIIWHETSTVPGNISAIKRLVMSNDRGFIDDDDVVSTIALQHKRLNLGLSFDSPAHHRAAEDGE
ncbi:hypothetical protein FAUST_9025 [Fusarium austroamericanum]|uniref:Uncharacterized protein n=1 Tax=Fusarium austroamericanum TaxID=282268 RepID=A0AAN5Z4P3_FUSAU|nr:hypothetical protein FAUST_9025 [Fusarium austroamericanum]